LPKKIKKDFDKEKMYSKIMPSLAMAERQKEEPGDAPVSAAGDDGEPLPKLHNYMEDMMADKLAHTTKVLGACDCPRCQQDILALALNQLPAAYAVAETIDEPRYLAKLKGVYEVKVTAALIKAIQQVKINPRH
jgi:competence protein ComFB